MGLVSFGMGMVMAPILLLLLDPQSVVTSVNSLSVLLLTIVLIRTRHDVPLRAVLPMTLTGLAATPVGVLILSSASPGTLRITIAAVILLLALPSALNVQRPLPRTGLLSPLFGFLGSMLTTGLGVGIPLVALFLGNQMWSGRAIRASIALYHLVVATGAVTLYAATGLFTLERGWLLLRLSPAAPLGFGLAVLLSRHIDDVMLRRLIVAVIIVASLALLIRDIPRL